MKTLSLFVVGILMSWLASAQSDSTVLKSAFGGTVGMGVGHRFLDNTNALFSDEEALYDSLETTSFSYFGELNYSRRISSHLRFQGGVGFMRMGYHVDSIPEAGIKKMQLNFHYGVVPIKLQWLSNESNRMTFTSSVGLVPMFLVKQNTRIYYIGDSREDNVDTQSDKKNFGFAAHVSAGMEAKVLKRYRLTTELFYRQSITPIAEGDMKRLLNAGGISVSIIKTL
jgi:hypothetical protein